MPNDRDDLDDAYADIAPPPLTSREKREEFQASRRRLVDLYTAASGGKLDHRAFNKVALDDFDTVAAEHGVRGWADALEENARLRSALVQEVVGRHRHLTPEDLDELADSATPFDAERWHTHAAEVSEQRSAGAQAILANALQDLGIDTSVEGFDLGALLQKAAAPTTEPTTPAYVSTPQSRTASLPTGRPFTPPKTWDDGNLSGLDAIEAAAQESLDRLGIRR